ncbi:MAG: CRISPR-associated endonuclease Cas2, partial [Planktothrix sp.]
MLILFDSEFMVVVVYDISNDKRRVKLSNFLEGYGHRIQFSVFECFISLEEMRQLHQKVKKLVLPK